MLNRVTSIPDASKAIPWIQLHVPATEQALAPIQALLHSQAQSLGFSRETCQRMSAACDEALSTILRLSYDCGEDAANTLEVHIGHDDTAIQVRLSDHGLPYDLSLLPQYCPRQPELAQDDASGLSAFLMHKLADRCQVLNQGSQGHHVELQWLLPKTKTADADGVAEIQATDVAVAVAPTPAQRIITRPLQQTDAIHLARLVYRSYGYSYVNPDMYIAERISERVADGRLTSWVAVDSEDPQGIPVGHIAFMKGHRDDDTLEVGSAVVAPTQRGGGLLGQLLSMATDALLARPERAAFVHAVTAHPFTQKTFGRLGYLPTALLLAYTPASLQFRNISGRPHGQRGSVYYACKLLKPAEPIQVYLQPQLQALVMPRAADIGLDFQLQTLAAVDFKGDTEWSVQVEDALNAAFFTLQRAGSDWAGVLRKQLRALCRQHVDVMYLSLDMSDSQTPQACQVAMDLGFIPAGLTPFMPWPATLCLQYLNNQHLQADAVCAVGPAAEQMRDMIFEAYQAQEMLQ